MVTYRACIPYIQQNGSAPPRILTPDEKIWFPDKPIAFLRHKKIKLRYVRKIVREAFLYYFEDLISTCKEATLNKILWYQILVALIVGCSILVKSSDSASLK